MIYICYIKHVKKVWERELTVRDNELDLWDSELALSGGYRDGREMSRGRGGNNGNPGLEFRVGHLGNAWGRELPGTP